MINVFLITPILFPFILAIILALKKFEESIRNRIVIGGISANFILIVFIILNFRNSTIHILKLNEFVDIYFNIDGIGILFSFLVSLLWIFSAIYSSEYMSHERKRNRFFIFFTATLGVTIGIAFSGNLITLYVFYELLTLCTFPLVIHAGNEEALKCGYKYLIYSFTGATFSLFGMFLVFSKTQTLDFTAGGIIDNIQSVDHFYFLIAYTLTFLGFGVKAGLVPFHSWLPSAMVAPTPVSALLHAVAVVKSGIFSLFRMTYFIFGPAAIIAIKGNLIALGFILATILTGSFLAIHQNNLKKRLAYSTISQLGYIMLGLVVFNPNGFVGGILHMIFHAFIKITLFFCVGAVMHITHKTEIHEIQGLGKQLPKLMWCFSLSSISLIGIPPTNGFVSKWYLATGGLQYGNVIVAIVLLLSALLTAGYLFPIISTAFFKPIPEGEPIYQEPGKKMLVPIIILTGIVLITGFFPNPLIAVLNNIAGTVM